MATIPLMDQVTGALFGVFGHYIMYGIVAIIIFLCFMILVRTSALLSTAIALTPIVIYSLAVDITFTYLDAAFIIIYGFILYLLIKQMLQQN